MGAREQPGAAVIKSGGWPGKATRACMHGVRLYWEKDLQIMCLVPGRYARRGSEDCMVSWVAVSWGVGYHARTQQI